MWVAATCAGVAVCAVLTPALVRSRRDIRRLQRGQLDQALEGAYRQGWWDGRCNRSLEPVLAVMAARAVVGDNARMVKP